MAVTFFSAPKYRLTNMLLQLFVDPLNPLIENKQYI